MALQLSIIDAKGKVSTYTTIASSLSSTPLPALVTSSRHAVQQHTKASKTTQNAAYDFSDLRDGSYSGTGNGRNGSIEVTVKVKNGKVTSITIESSREDSQYMNRAKDTVIGEIIDSQSLNVQTVSGATMSSNGIIEAVANALGIEYTNTNSQLGGRSHRSH